MNAPQPSPSPRPTIDLVVDGHRAELLEVSASHAVVYSQMALKPEQRVRIVLRANDTVLRTHARVKVAKYQMPKEGPRYRVELAFDGDTEALEKFVAEVTP